MSFLTAFFIIIIILLFKWYVGPLASACVGERTCECQKMTFGELSLLPPWAPGTESRSSALVCIQPSHRPLLQISDRRGAGRGGVSAHL